jgi:hypothetical protein
MIPDEVASRIAALRAEPVEQEAKPKHFHFEPIRESCPLDRMCDFSHRMSWARNFKETMWHLIQNDLLRGLTSAGALLLMSAPHACSGPDFATVPPPRASASYYLDCSAGQNGNGTQASPWNSRS